MVIVVRHGRSEWNRHKRVSGQLDPDLNAEGEMQARALAGALQGGSIDAIHTSPLRRALKDGSTDG